MIKENENHKMIVLDNAKEAEYEKVDCLINGIQEESAENNILECINHLLKHKCLIDGKIFANSTEYEELHCITI